MWVVVAVRCCSHAGGVRVGCNNYHFCPELCAWECNEPMEFDRIMIQFCALSPIRNPYLMFLSIVIPIHRNALMLISPPCSIICNTVPSVRAHWNPVYIYTYFGWFLYIWGKNNAWIFDILFGSNLHNSYFDKDLWGWEKVKSVILQILICLGWYLHIHGLSF